MSKNLPIKNIETSYQKKGSLRKLYEEVGGESGLEAILDSFYNKMAQDILIGYFFTGKDLKKIARMQKAFLMKAWGISQAYTGKFPAQAHKHLPDILKGHFDRRLVILRQTLQEFKISSEWIDVWVKFESGFRKAVQTPQ